MRGEVASKGRWGSGRVAILVAIVLGSVAFGLSQIGASRLWLHSYGDMHFVYHAALFAAFGFLAVLGSPRPWVRVCWLVVAVLIGLGIEYGEVMRFGIAMEWFDVWTDLAGLAVGALGGWVLVRRLEGDA